MKTLTEFSTLMLRKAAAARATVATSRPSATNDVTIAADATDVATSVEPAAEAAPEAHAEAAAQPPASEPIDAAVEAGPPAEPEAVPQNESEGAEPAAASAASAASAVSAVSGDDAAPDPAIAAVAEACGVQPDRAARLLEALDIIDRNFDPSPHSRGSAARPGQAGPFDPSPHSRGSAARPGQAGPFDRIRLVRVYQGEKGPHHAISRGEFHYVIDRVAGPGRDRRNDSRGHGAPSGRDNRDRGGGGGGGGGGAGGSFRGSDRKPRGLGSLKFGATTEAKDPSDERPGRGEMPRAGIGWQLTPSPRTAEDFARAQGRRRPPGGRRPPRGGAKGPHGRGEDRGSSNPKSFQTVRPPNGSSSSPRVGADGQPVPPRNKRPRKPLGPDANGLGPDGTPWDPERRAKRMAERSQKPNDIQPEAVVSAPEAPPPPAEESK